MHCLGIDIGGSGIKGAPVETETGVLLAERYRLPTPNPAAPAEVAHTVAELVQHFSWQGPIGCGFPAAIRRGIVVTAANIHESWIGTDLAALLQQATGCPIRALNDADAAGLAEMAFGAGKGQPGVVLIVTVGTGIGSALFIDGHLLPNTELGHIEIRGKEAERRASDAARQRKGLSWEAWAARFDEYLPRMDALIWPDRIIVGGGGSKTPEHFLPYLTLKTPVVPAQLQNDAGMIGAALAAGE